jgi:hypothetical protein
MNFSFSHLTAITQGKVEVGLKRFPLKSHNASKLGAKRKRA